MIRAIFIVFVVLCPLGTSPKGESHTQDIHKRPARECQDASEVLGFAVVEVEDKTVLPFFTKPDSSEPPALTVRLFQDPTINSINHRVQGAEHFRPATLHLDYHLFELSVKSRHRGWLKVVVDEQTDRTLWMREGRAVRFVGWLPKMISAFGVARTDQKINHLRVKPLAQARVVRFTGRDCFKVERMNGDWIRVVQQDHCDQVSRTSVRGWVRWRDNRGCLLVDIYPFV